MLMVFYSMDTKAAIAISSFIILTGSVTRFFVTFNQKHPTKDATCIDYGLTNVMLPTVFIGTVSGVIFNIMLPDIMIQICLTCLLSFLSI